MNSITVCGYVGQADFRPAKNGGPILMTFTVADNLFKRGPRSEKETIWWRCAVWGEKANQLSRLIHKGTYVVAVGSLRPDNYTDRQGEKHERLQLWVDQVDVRNPPERRMDRPPAHDPSVTPFKDDSDKDGGFDDDVPF